MTSVIHVSANTSVHPMCGVAPGVNKIGVKCEIMHVMRDVQVSASVLESIGFRLRVNSEVSTSFKGAAVVSVASKGNTSGGVSVSGRSIVLPVADSAMSFSGINREVSNTDFTTFCGSTVAPGREASETSKSVVVTK